MSYRVRLAPYDREAHETLRHDLDGLLHPHRLQGDQEERTAHLRQHQAAEPGDCSRYSGGRRLLQRGRGGSRRYFGFLSEENAKTLPRKCFCVFLGVKR